MAKGYTEQQVLKKLDIPDFRHMSKDKIMAFVSTIPQMDPAVAISALKQFPEFTKTSIEIMKSAKELQSKSLDDNSQSVEAFYTGCNAVIDQLNADLTKGDMSDEQRDKYIAAMMTVLQMMSDKDSQNKQFLLNMIKIIGGTAVLAIGGIAASIYGKGAIENPGK
ncbi:hypothetical protein [Bifidobacterium sp. ESL0704]|uniref:hypothetical protein n=1 Tax=Bifidobacterium sp. ESL0704 TaxID=2983219 RepID=UPI0023F7F422|nr:hypothetical protein [Bifidobacterium sp. ESL0704]WEV52508.1 hypothetical protein OZX64_06370 [Bifidobacterium sp. ESL0704]